MVQQQQQVPTSVEDWEDEEDDLDDDSECDDYFPSSKARHIHEGLNGPTSVYAVQDLHDCLLALSRVLKEDPPKPDVVELHQFTAWDDAREFVMQVLPMATEKFTQHRADNFIRFNAQHSRVLFGCIHLCFSCAVRVLRLAAEVPDVRFLDDEACTFLSILYNLLDGRAAVYSVPAAQLVPQDTPKLDDAPPTESQGAASAGGQPAGDTEFDKDVEDDDPDSWLSFLLKGLLDSNFLPSCFQILEFPAAHTLLLHHHILAVLQAVFNVSTQHSFDRGRLRSFSRVGRGINILMEHASGLIAKEADKLGAGRERGYSSLSNILACCHTLCQLLRQPDDQVTAVQRQVVLELLKSSNFTRLLSAVHECRNLLEHAKVMVEVDQGEAVEDNVGWLKDESVVKQMLRANLHQQQYAEAVLHILRLLAECGHFSNEDLGMLWAVTEQEGTFDAVKNNVCFMIKQLAAFLRPEHLDLLFSKFDSSSSKGRSLSDTLRLLDLLRQLAHSDVNKASSTAGKLLELVWDLTMPADAPPELLNSNALYDVLEGYQRESYLEEYIGRCITQLRARQNAYTALTALKSLLLLWAKLYGTTDNAANGAKSLSKLLSLLDKRAGQSPLTKLLVDNICELVGNAGRWLEERRPMAGTQPPGQGSYSYQQILKRYLDVLKLTWYYREYHMPAQYVEQLWDSIVLRANTPEDMLAGLDFVSAGARGEGAPGLGTTTPFLEAETLALLLKDRIMRLPADNLSQPAFQCFKTTFKAFSKETEKVRESEQVKAIHEQGTQFLWHLLLDCQRLEVQQSATDMLIEVYKTNYDQMVRDTRQRLLAVASLLLSASPDTEQWDKVELPRDVMESGEWEQAKVRATRCLQLLERLMEMGPASMPPVPMHRASYQGVPLAIDVTGTDQRFKLTSHTNEYVGLLRRKVAAKADCSPAYVRLIAQGQELKHDGKLIADALPANWNPRAPIMYNLSGKANQYTREDEQWWSEWHEHSPMAHVYHDEQLYHVLLLLADLPKAPAVRMAAAGLLQQLPTCKWVPASLWQALHSPQPAEQLQHLLLGPSGSVDRPGRLLYTLQALYAQLVPSYPEDLLQQAMRPWPPENEVGGAPHLNADARLERLMAVMPACVPLLAEVVGRTMQLPDKDVKFMGSFHWVMVFLICTMCHMHEPKRAQVLEQKRAVDPVAAVKVLLPDSQSTCLETADQQTPPNPPPPAVVLVDWEPPAQMNTPESISAEPDAMQSDLVPASGSGGPAAAAAAMVSELAVSSRGSPDVCGDAAAARRAVAASTADAPQPTRMSITATSNEEPADVEMQAAKSSLEPDATAMSTDLGTAEQAMAAIAPEERLSSLAVTTPTAVAPPEVGLPPQPPAQLSMETLSCIVSLLVRMAYDAGRLWDCSAEPQQQAAEPTSGTLGAAQPHQKSVDMANRLAAKSLVTLAKLLQQPQLLQGFLADGRSGPMLQETLLCPHAEAIRQHALLQLDAIFLHEGSPDPNAYLWLMQQLVLMQPLLYKRLGCCLEYHHLLCKLLSKLPDVVLPAARAVAEALLAQEVDRLANDVEQLVQPACEALLQGKLLLVRSLVVTLDRLTVGLDAAGKPGLIGILTSRYLFPEAELVWQPPQQLPIEQMEAVLRQTCQSNAVRQQGLALLQALMTGCTANLEQGLGELRRLHYDNGFNIKDSKFDVTGDCVRLPGGYMGMRNGGATCYMNAVLQQLFMQPRIRSLVLGARMVDVTEHSDSIFHQLQVMMANLALGRANCYNPREFWRAFKDYDGQSIDVREHQDAYEFFTRLQDAVDSHLRASGQTPAMQHVMGGKFAQQIICKDVNYRSEREEEFYQISVDVKNCGSLEKSLEGYVAGELMEGENSYFCEDLGSRVAAVKRTCIKELPQTLVIHLKRFEYDHLNMTRHKLRERFEFPVSLDMFRYTADGLAALEAPTVQLAAQGNSARPRNYYLYELKGVVVHTGTAFAGHYYSYIKARPKIDASGKVEDGEWFCFDDKTVKPWDISNLENDCFGGRANAGGNPRLEAERPYSAYMLFYERKDTTCYEDAAIVRAVPAGEEQQQQQAGREQEAQAPAEGAGPAPTAEPADPSTMQVDGDGAEAARAEAVQGGAPGGEVAALAAAGGDGAALRSPASSSARPAAPPSPAAVTTPYGMPVMLYQNLLRDNLILLYKLHVLNKDYFGFVRQVVEVTCEGVLAGRKARRKDHPTNSGGNNNNSAGSGRPPSMNSGAEPATAADAVGGVAVMATVGPEPSSAPTQRNEERDVTLALSTQLGGSFLLSIYLPAPPALRGDLVAWRDQLMHLFQASPRSGLEFLKLLASHSRWLKYYATRPEECSLLMVLLAAAHVAALRLTHVPSSPSPPSSSTAAAAAAGGGAAGAAGAGDAAAAGSSTVYAAVEEATRQLVSVGRELGLQLHALCKDLTRSEGLPAIYGHIYRFITQLVQTDPAFGHRLLQHFEHLEIVNIIFALHTDYPIENDAGAVERAQELTPVLACLRALLVYTSAVRAVFPTTLQPLMQLDQAGQAVIADHQDCAIFQAVLAGSGLLHEPTVVELLHMLLYNQNAVSARFLDMLIRRFDRGDMLDQLALWDFVPAVLDIHDQLRQARLNYLWNTEFKQRGVIWSLINAVTRNLVFPAVVAAHACACILQHFPDCRQLLINSPQARTILQYADNYLTKFLNEDRFNRTDPTVLKIFRAQQVLSVAHAEGLPAVVQVQATGGGGGGGQQLRNSSSQQSGGEAPEQAAAAVQPQRPQAQQPADEAQAVPEEAQQDAPQPPQQQEQEGAGRVEAP